MVQQILALTIGTVKYGDSSLIANCFTNEWGLQSYMLKGILTAKRSNKVSKSYFEPLTLLELQAAKNSNNKLGFIQEIKLLHAYESIPFDIKKKAVVFFLAEVLQQVIREEPDPNPALFEFIKKRLLWMDSANHIGLFHVKFMIDLTKYIGFSPNIEQQNLPYFDLASGCMTNEKTKYCIDGLKKTQWLNVLGMKFDGLTPFKYNNQDKKTILNNVITYFELHLQHFKMPKSTVVLNEVFTAI